MRHEAADAQVRLNITVNGEPCTAYAAPRLLLSDYLRHELGLTGTHVGCEHGVCGACTVLLNGKAVRACLMLAIQADGCAITTVEGLSETPSELTYVQAAFRRQHALQCGFCTPGILMTLADMLASDPLPSEDEVLAAVAGHLCRCTGYVGITNAVRDCLAHEASQREARA